ncbi:hypothetical protein D3C71_2002750 [compost metagenome]
MAGYPGDASRAETNPSLPITLTATAITVSISSKTSSWLSRKLLAASLDISSSSMALSARPARTPSLAGVPRNADMQVAPTSKGSPVPSTRATT